MFQDDRMIPVLTAVVLMVVIGTVLQRVDGIDRFFGGTPAPAPGPALASATPPPVVPDSASDATGAAMPAAVAVAAASAGAVSAVAPAIPSAPPVLMAATPAAGDPGLSPAAPTPILSAHVGTAQLAVAAPAATLAPAPILPAVTDPAVAAKLSALTGTVSAALLEAPAAMPDTAGEALSKASAPGELDTGATPGGASRRLAALPGYAVPAGAGVPVIAALTTPNEPLRVAMTVATLTTTGLSTGLSTGRATEPGIAAALAAAPLPAGAALPGRSLRGAVPGGTPAVLAPWPGMPRLVLPGGADAGMAFAAATADTGPRPVQDPDAAGPSFLLAIIGNVGAGAAHTSVSNADPLAALSGLAAGIGAPEDGTRIAALAPARLAPTVAAPGPALDVLPAPQPAWLDAGRLDAARVAASAEDGVRAAALDPIAALPGPGDARAVTAPASPAVPVSRAVRAEPCLAPPDMTLEVHNAAETIVGVTAPCHAATVAELSYSGLRLAVPLDGNGQGVVRVQGFEPNTPALLTLGDGTAVDFELPFKGVDRISRIALAWEAPVELELNALEYGAAPGTPGHVRPGLARSFEEVRRSGGGYLTVWNPVGGLGQSLQVYSWYHRSGESAGVVKLLLDFVSRDRDRLATACGDGPAAAPQFIVLRSNAGRPDRPVLRQLAPIACDRVATQGRDNRLISGAVDDLVIMSR